MKHIFICFFFIINLSVSGQTSLYHPFPESNAVWNINFWLNCNWAGIANENYSISFTNDTLINSFVYHKLSTTYIESFSTGSCGSSSGPVTIYKGAIRQDTSARKVYIVPANSAVEELLYDFNLNVGDTVRGFTENQGYEDVVQSIDSVLVGSNYRKRWNINQGYQISIIEGVGSTFGLLEMSPGNVIDAGGYSLLCFSQDGHPLYPDTSIQCSLINSTFIQPFNKKLISISPNPSIGSFKIELYGDEFKSISIYNSIGIPILIFKETVGNSFKIDYLTSGIYTLIAMDKRNNFYSSKVVCIQ